MDGEAAEIFRADLAWRGVPLEEGRHTVRFAFHQPGLAAGTLITFMGLLLCVGLLAGQGVRGRRRKAAVSRDGLESRRS